MCRYVYIHVYTHTTYTHTQRTMICYTKSHQTFVVIAQILNNLLCMCLDGLFHNPSIMLLDYKKSCKQHANK